MIHGGEAKTMEIVRPLVIFAVFGLLQFATGSVATHFEISGSGNLPVVAISVTSLLFPESVCKIVSLAFCRIHVDGPTVFPDDGIGYKKSETGRGSMSRH